MWIKQSDWNIRVRKERRNTKIFPQNTERERERTSKREGKEEIENRCDTTQRCSISNLESSVAGCLAFPLDPVCSKWCSTPTFKANPNPTLTLARPLPLPFPFFQPHLGQPVPHSRVQKHRTQSRPTNDQTAPKQVWKAIRRGYFDGGSDFFFWMPLKAMDKMSIRVNTATGRKGIAKGG